MTEQDIEDTPKRPLLAMQEPVSAPGVTAASLRRRRLS